MEDAGLIPGPPGGRRAGSGKGSKPPPWASIEASDLGTYVARLRDAGIPEPTVRHVIEAEVDRRFDGRMRSLKARGRDCRPWEAPPSHPLATLELRRKARRLFREKRALLEGLLGYEVLQEVPAWARRPEEEEYDAALPKIPEEKRKRVRSILEAYWEGRDDLEWLSGAPGPSEEALAHERLEAGCRDDLASVLSPIELETFEMATSSLGRMLAELVKGFDPTEGESRAMFRALCEAAERVDGKDAVLEESFRTLLGKERYLELERSRTPCFRTLAKITEESGLSREDAVRAHALHDIALEKAAHARDDTSLSDAERHAALDALITETEQALRALLGVEGLREFQKSRHYGFRGERLDPGQGQQ